MAKHFVLPKYSKEILFAKNVLNNNGKFMFFITFSFLND